MFRHVPALKNDGQQVILNIFRTLIKMGDHMGETAEVCTHSPWSTLSQRAFCTASNSFDSKVRCTYLLLDIYRLLFSIRWRQHHHWLRQWRQMRSRVCKRVNQLRRPPVPTQRWSQPTTPAQSNLRMHFQSNACSGAAPLPFHRALKPHVGEAELKIMLLTYLPLFQNTGPAQGHQMLSASFHLCIDCDSRWSRSSGRGRSKEQIINVRRLCA